MERNKIISLALVILIVLAHPMSVFATEVVEKGSVRIELSDGAVGTSKDNVVFEYAKVAIWENGTYKIMDAYEGMGIEIKDIKSSKEMDEVVRKLDAHVIVDGVVKTDRDGKAVIPDLNPGVYLLRVSDKAKYDNVYPVLIGVPTWNEITKNMDYEVTVIPKHSPDEPEKIVTGDNHPYINYVGISIISLILVVGLTCHNHFKCGKIAGNYSEKGGYTHGNDNDTKNPRCTRRVRPRGGRSVN